MGKQKKNSYKPFTEKIALVTVLIKLVNAIIEMIKTLIE